MRWLAIDTSSWWGSVALAESDDRDLRTVAVVGDRIARTHARTLLEWIEQALDQAGWSRDSISRWVAIRGPGSFTGIRIALGALQGFAISSGKPCFGVNALEAMLLSAPESEQKRLVLIGAGRGEYYGAGFGAGPSVEALDELWHEADVETPDYWLDVAERSEAQIIYRPPNDVAKRDLACREGLAAAEGESSLAPAAARLAWLGRTPDESTPASLSPLYIRPPDVRLPTHLGGGAK